MVSNIPDNFQIDLFDSKMGPKWDIPDQSGLGSNDNKGYPILFRSPELEPHH